MRRIVGCVKLCWCMGKLYDNFIPSSIQKWAEPLRLTSVLVISMAAVITMMMILMVSLYCGM